MITLTTRDLDLWWNKAELGPLPYPLDVPSIGDTEEERTRLRQEIQPDQRAEDLLRLLAEHEVAVHAVGSTGRAIATSAGTRAVLAVLDDEKVSLTEIRPTSLARSIVEVLPAAKAGPGSSLSVRLEALKQAAEPQEDENDPWGGEDDDRQALRKAGLSTQDAALLDELTAGRVAGGQFGVTGSKTLVNWFDTDQGRYLVVTEDGWMSLSPADNERIATRIEEVLSP
ncbi:ESX secretion-associated protein EspG [Lentzea sp. NBRC 105346]|uniref:ESX secretion-associated protein EspG n=1 Tax=Lentzea sp. NBRC 105346 TaxID=3032205 RepID=UPI0024A5BFA9|nr:ESX secretion-associated protein EspG [Lentzea sp. NBRC 105346]GLZ29290.1 ESX secretion-associated protein EspG [Lentzea sp. NBRC 105346]